MHWLGLIDMQWVLLVWWYISVQLLNLTFFSLADIVILEHLELGGNWLGWLEESLIELVCLAHDLVRGLGVSALLAWFALLWVNLKVAYLSFDTFFRLNWSHYFSLHELHCQCKAVLVNRLSLEYVFDPWWNFLGWIILEAADEKSLLGFDLEIIGNA